jgi:hypothetical protein
MNKKYDRTNFLAYIHNPMSKESVSVLLAANNIKFEKSELYSDFVQSLLMRIFDTYLGDEVMDYDSQLKHFKWCWEKTVDDFAKESINIKNPKLYNYFLEFTIEVFYSYKEKKPFEYADKVILRIWSDIFNFTKTKTNSDIDTLIEIYTIFEKSLKII